MFSSLSLRLMALLCLFSFLCACAGGPRKDVYFRTRLPTLEDPDINGPGKISIDLEAQSHRFTGTLTNNLVKDFSFRKGDAGLDRGNLLKGLDLNLGFSQAVATIPFQIDATFDNAKLKIQTFDLREHEGTGFFSTVDYAIAQTSFYEENGGCTNFICFGERSKSDEATEQSIEVGHKGSEQKIGTSLGYTFAPRHSTYIGYHWYDTKIFAQATQGENEINFGESFYGHGIGIGYLYRPEPNFKITMTAEDINMSWNGHESHQVMFTFNFSWCILVLL